MADHRGKAVGQQLGNYRLVRLLGSGGFADVYLGEHLHLGTAAAIKVLRTRMAGDEIAIFLKEARTIARLVHPHIIRVLDFAVEGMSPFLVMDYVPGGSLRQKHPRGVAVPLTTVVDYVKQVADALHYAHENKVVHRDVKPENMLIDQYGKIVLSDFGVASIAHSTESQTVVELAGTIAYIAPEQLHGLPRLASDQYTLAVVVYEWISGERPFRGTFAEIASQHLLKQPPLLYGRVPGVSRALEDVVFKALAKEPRNRFASVRDFAQAFEQAYQESYNIYPATWEDELDDDIDDGEPTELVRAINSASSVTVDLELVRKSITRKNLSENPFQAGEWGYAGGGGNSRSGALATRRAEATHAQERSLVVDHKGVSLRGVDPHAIFGEALVGEGLLDKSLKPESEKGLLKVENRALPDTDSLSHGFLYPLSQVRLLMLFARFLQYVQCQKTQWKLALVIVPLLVALMLGSVVLLAASSDENPSFKTGGPAVPVISNGIGPIQAPAKGKGEVNATPVQSPTEVSGWATATVGEATKHKR